MLKCLDAYAHVPDNLRQKLDPKANKLLFVGYQRNSNNYRLIDPNTFKVMVAASVTFIDGKGDFDFQKAVGAERTLVDVSEDTDEEDKQVEQEDRLESSKEDEEPPNGVDEKGNEIRRNLRDRSVLKPPDRHIQQVSL